MKNQTTARRIGASIIASALFATYAAPARAEACLAVSARLVLICQAGSCIRPSERTLCQAVHAAKQTRLTHAAATRTAARLRLDRHERTRQDLNRLLDSLQ